MSRSEVVSQPDRSDRASSASDRTDAVRFGARHAPRAVRIPLVVVAGAGFTFASLAPSVTFGIHLLRQPLSFQNWAFAYPLTATALAGVALLWSSISRRPVRSWPWAIWPLGALTLWSLMSVWWSVLPDATASRALTAIGIAAFGAWFGYELHFDEQLMALASFAATTTLGSYALILWWPGVGRNISGRNEWQGVFAGPNSLGPAAAVGVVTALGVAARYRNRRWIVSAAVVTLLPNLLLLQRSSSVTAAFAVVAGIATVVVVLVVWQVAAHGLSGRAVGLAAAVGGSVAVVAATTRLGAVASFFGQDPTLARRTLIWHETRQFIADRPLQGYGYWAFWENLDYAGPSYVRLGNEFGSAHNSFLEMFLGLGIVGLVLFTTLVITSIVAVSILVWRNKGAASIYWAAVLTVVLTEHLMESFVLWHSYVWILLVASAFLPVTDGEATERWGSDRSTRAVRRG